MLEAVEAVGVATSEQKAEGVKRYIWIPCTVPHILLLTSSFNCILYNKVDIIALIYEWELQM